MSWPACDDVGDTNRVESIPHSGEEEAVRSAVHAVEAGDRDAFAVLVELFERRLFALMLMVTRNRSAAEELTQDTFVRAFRNLDRYDVRRPFYPWLATIGFRRAQSLMKRQTQRSRVEGVELTSCDGVDEHDPLEKMIEDQTKRQLWKTVESLPAGERTAVILYYRQELKVAEVAAVLCVTVGTVKTLLFRARRHLRALLEDSPPNSETDEPC